MGIMIFISKPKSIACGLAFVCLALSAHAGGTSAGQISGAHPVMSNASSNQLVTTIVTVASAGSPVNVNIPTEILVANEAAIKLSTPPEIQSYNNAVQIAPVEVLINVVRNPQYQALNPGVIERLRELGLAQLLGL